MKLRNTWFAFTLTVVIVAGASLAPVAGASPITDKQAQAAALEQAISKNGDRIEQVGELMNQAKLNLQTLDAQLGELQAHIADTKRSRDAAQELVRAIAVRQYMQAGTDQGAFLSAGGVSDQLTRDKYSSVVSGHEQSTIQNLNAANADYADAQRSLKAQRADAERRRKAIAADQVKLNQAIAEQMKLLAKTKGDLGKLVQQAEAQQAAAEAARGKAAFAARMAAAARQARSTSAGSPQGNSSAAPSGSAPGARGDGGLPLPGNVAAPSPGAAAAVAYARAQVGKPYRYAGVGPDAYDCSGLTMMAWAQAGVSMPHGSIAQGNMFPRVPDDQLQPGDLSIYYPDHHHVGMYVGGGVTISATHTGSFVKVQPVFREGYQYSVRPG
jgi:cell wall-associated NlpC family hydrolase